MSFWGHLLLTLALQTAAPPQVEFPASCTQAAHEKFLQGVAKLHNSAYDEAAVLFRAAQQLDRNCAIAVWGEALTFNHQFWGEQDLLAGRRALAKLGPNRAVRAAKGATARERGYLNAVEILYGDGDRNQRDFAYAEAMKKLAFDNPADYEAAAFYAAALLGTVRLGDADFSKQEAAAAIAKAILQKYPDHPGGLHYFIHACDDVEHAHLALEAARHYEKVADQNFHAMHMPAHIYVQLGMWAEALRSNDEAFTQSDHYVQHNKLSLAKRDYHSLDWLQYAEMQLGLYQKARSRTETMLEAARQSGIGGMNGVAAEMAARFAVETEQWDALAPFPLESRTPKLLFAQGRAAVRKGNLAYAKSAVSRIDALVRQFASEGQRIKSQQVDTLSKELSADIALVEKKNREAEEFALQAVRIETALRVPSVLEQGGILKPAVELYGELLLKLNKPDQAAEQFSLSLKRTPKRALSLLGLARAQVALGKTLEARETYRELASMWANADPTIPAVSETRRFVDRNPQ